MSIESQSAKVELVRPVRPKEKEEELEIFFQAVGVVYGDVIVEEKNFFVFVQNQKFPLKSSYEKKGVFIALKQTLKKTGNKSYKLLVYPRMLHFPSREKEPIIIFELVGFQRRSEISKRENDAFRDLKDLEFKFSGLWQFIPVSRVPCISVFKNFTDERKQFLKEAEIITKVKFTKASHLPLLWRDSSVAPFRFNPKVEKEQRGKAVFVQVKAKFLPSRNCFGFVEQLGEPTEEIPKYLKASKVDKAKVQAESKRNTQDDRTDKKKEEEETKEERNENSSFRTSEKPRLKRKSNEGKEM